MKRVLFLITLCVAVSTTGLFAQTKSVNRAESLAKSRTPNFAEARTLIQAALQSPETKDDAKAWYVAGYIEDRQFDAERAKQLLGQPANEAVMYEALSKVWPYFQKAYELDQLPDAKGKVNPKNTKNIMGILSANHVYYINSGAYYFDQKDYQKASDAFEQYLEIAHFPAFQNEKVAEKNENYNTVLFYSAVAATQLKDSPKAIAALERAKTSDHRASDIYQYLAYEYEQVGDTAKWEQTLEEGMAKFPEEKYFLMVLINNYIYSNRNEQAITFLNKAIADEPTNPQLYDVLGRVYETGLSDAENAEKYFLQALEVDPNYVEALIDLGRIYYNKGVNVQGDANTLTDNTKYQEEVAKAKDYFNKALPYFVKARAAKPDEREVLVALRGIYYNLNMGAEFEEIEKAMGISE